MLTIGLIVLLKNSEETKRANSKQNWQLVFDDSQEGARVIG